MSSDEGCCCADDVNNRNRFAFVMYKYGSELMPDSLQRVRDTDTIIFECNICDTINEARPSSLERDNPTCGACGSSVRHRAIIHALTTELFGQSVGISQIRPRHFEISGYGLSCWNEYAQRLRRRLGFENTFFHRQPYLDITDIRQQRTGTLDFLIASDVFEHVAPPVERAFENARRLLKKDGVFIITVPFTHPGEAGIPLQEHYPNLFDYKVRRSEEGTYVLENTTRTGVKHVHRDLTFHNGPGSTLEMRVFSESSLTSLLRSAGFERINIFSGTHLARGIYWQNKCSVPIAARVEACPPRPLRSPKSHGSRGMIRRKSMILIDRVAAKLHRIRMGGH